MQLLLKLTGMGPALEQHGFFRSSRSRLSESLTGRWMFPPAGFDSSFEFAAKTMLLDTEASSFVLRAETPLRPPQKRGRLHPLPAKVKIQVLIILIVVSVLGLLCVPDSVISAARRGPSKSQQSRLQAKR